MKNFITIILVTLCGAQIWAGPKDLKGNDMCDRDTKNEAVARYKLLARCRVVTSGSTEKALFDVDKMEVCIRKAGGWMDEDSYIIGDKIPDYIKDTQSFVRGYFYTSYIGPLSATYVGKKQSKDHLFPGSKDDPTFQPGEKIEGDYLSLSGPSFFVSESGQVGNYTGGTKTKYTDNAFVVVEKELDGMADIDGTNSNYHRFRTTLAFDRLKQTLNFKYERGGFPVTLSWKTLVDVALTCEVEPTEAH